MSKTSELNRLFKIWQQKQKKETPESLEKTMLKNTKTILPCFFCEDGIICEDQYNSEVVKTLFITNEPNIEGQENIDPISSRIKNFKDYKNSHQDDWRGKLRQRICEILYPAITNTNETYFPVNDGYDNATKIAFMNLNKRGGKGNTEKHLKEYCDYYKKEIIEEIKIIDPCVIIWLGKKSFNMCASVLFDNIIDCDNYWIVTIDNRNIPLISTYHTSARISAEKRAEDIKNKYKSIKDNI